MSAMNVAVNNVLNVMERSSGTPWMQWLLQILALSQSMQPAGWPPNYKVQNGDKFDFIVVGSGSAGAVVAARLSEVKDWRVLLIEAGGDPPVASVMPSMFATLAHTQVDWDYYGRFDKGIGLTHPSGIQFMTRGKVLGGSSSVNYEIYCRGVPGDYEEWGQIAPGWDWKSTLPYFKKLEGMTDSSVFTNPNNARLHSTKGPVLVSRPTPNEYFQEKNEIFLESLEEIGFKRILELNGPEIFGATRPHFTFANGRRSSTAEAYLLPAKRRPNLKIAKYVRVTKILIDPYTNHAYGVEALLRNGKKIKLFANNEVIVSAGTIDSPKLLMLSGIGPAEELNKFNIDVLVDLPVGKNYHDHQTASLTFSGDGIQTAAQNIATVTELNAYPVPAQTGLFSLNFTAFSHKPQYQLFNIHTGATGSPLVFTTCRSTTNFDVPYCQSLANANLANELDATQLILLHPKSRGQVKLKSRNPLDDPIIEVGFYRNEDDVKAMVEGLKYLSNIVHTKYFRKVGGEIVRTEVKGCEGKKWGTDDYWACYVKSIVASLLHPVGTCAMGFDGVVDERLRVHGVTGLRVIDASVIPKIVSGTINAPVMMIGERASDLIKEEYLTNNLSRYMDMSLK